MFLPLADPNRLAETTGPPNNAGRQCAASMASGTRPASPGLAALRGILAVSIVCHHVATTMADPEGAVRQLLFGGIFDYPAGRIEFFFVASAFLVTLGQGPRAGTAGAAARFLRRRLLAILPLYWFVLAALLLIGSTPWGYGPGRFPDPEVIASSFLLIGPDPGRNLLVVAWTLFHELLFYAAFALILARPRLGLAVAALWSLAIIAGLAGAGTPPLPAYVFAPVNLLFAIGGLAALGWRRWSPPPRPLLLAALFATAGTMILGADGLPVPARSLAWGAIWAAVIAALLGFEARGGLRLPLALPAFGRAAFAIYLLQFPVISQVAQAAQAAADHGWPWLAADPERLALATIAAVVASGLLLHLVVERRLLRWTAAPKLAVAGSQTSAKPNGALARR